MSPKRRYQSSSVCIGLPPPPLPPPEYFANLNYSYNRPITPAEIAVNPCLSSRKIGTVSVTPGGGATKKSSKPEQEKKKAPPTTPATTPTTGNNKTGGRTYRVRHHHQNHYDLPVAQAPPNGGDSARPSNSLSQGIFGLPAVQDFFLRSSSEELLNAQQESLMDQVPPPTPPQPTPRSTPKPRMKTTLPSFKNVLDQQQSPSHSHLPSQGSAQDMDSVLQVRPANRSRTRPEQLSTSAASVSRKPGPGARRRVQSTAAYHHRPSTSEEHPPSIASPHQGALSSDQSSDNLEILLLKLRRDDQFWEDILSSFQNIQRLSQDNPKIIKPILKKVIWSGLPHLSSHRTKLSRAACQCFKTLYETQQRFMEGEGDKVFTRLLDLCGGPQNKFIQEECKGALQAAVRNTDPVKCLGLLEQHGSKHRNQNVREFAAHLLQTILELVGVDKIMGGKDKDWAQRVLPMIAGFLKEGQLNTR